MPLTLLTFHHFHSLRKLASLQTLTRQPPACCCALYLMGRPGALLVSSADTTHLHDYVKAVKRLRWQRVHTLGTSEDPAHVLRRLPLGALEAVGVGGGVAALAASAEEYSAGAGAGVGEWVRGRIKGGFAKGGLR